MAAEIIYVWKFNHPKIGAYFVTNLRPNLEGRYIPIDPDLPCKLIISGNEIRKEILRKIANTQGWMPVEGRGMQPWVERKRRDALVTQIRW